MREQAVPVPAALRSWVLSTTVATADDLDPLNAIEPPDTATALIICAAKDRPATLAVTGPRTRAGYHIGVPAPLRITVRLQPGRAQLLLGRPVSDLVDRVVPLHAPWAEHLTRELPDPTNALEQALLTRLATRTPRDMVHSDLAHRATTILSTGLGVHAAAQRLHLSERRLRDLFTDAVGLSPKHFARIARLRAVLADAGRDTWANLAAEIGYSDHSHLTAEFRKLMGVPPGTFVSGRLPPAKPCYASTSTTAAITAHQ